MYAAEICAQVGSRPDPGSGTVAGSGTTGRTVPKGMFRDQLLGQQFLQFLHEDGLAELREPLGLATRPRTDGYTDDSPALSKARIGER